MQTPKKYLILLLILLIISGCGGGGKTYPVTSVDIYKGIDGVTAEFFNVPDEVFEGTKEGTTEKLRSFRINVELENKGAYNVKEGYLTLSVEDDYIEFMGWIKPPTKDTKPSEEDFVLREEDKENNKRIGFELKGKTMETPLGKKAFVGVDVGAREIKEKQSERHHTDVLLTTCYGYQTQAVPTVCIDTTMYGFKEKEKSCQVGDIILTDQGAPVAVTKVETEMLPQETGKDDKVKPMFLIYIENKGNGEVISTKEIERDDKGNIIGDSPKDNLANIKDACSGEQLTHYDFSYVFVEAELGKDNKLSCSPNGGLVKLKERKGVARCILEKGISGDKGTYTAPLKITIDYGYTFTISKEVTVKRLLSY